MRSFDRYIIPNGEELASVVWSADIDKIFRETKSNILIEEDASSVQLKLICGDITWLRYRLRDRRFDGPGWIRTPIVDWRYDKTADKFPFLALEESIYCLDPRYPLTDIFPLEIADFIKNPFEAIPFDSKDLVYKMGRLRAWANCWNFINDSSHSIYPGYFSARNIPGVRRAILDRAIILCRSSGYGYLTAVPTWWHISSMYEHLGFRYFYEEDRKSIQDLKQKLTVWADNTERSRARASWIVMLQFWAMAVEELGMSVDSFGISEEFILRSSDNGMIMTFPLSPERNLWVCRRV